MGATAKVNEHTMTFYIIYLFFSLNLTIIIIVWNDVMYVYIRKVALNSDIILGHIFRSVYYE